MSHLVESRGWLMRKIWALLVLLMLSGGAYAVPSPLPPEDFAGTQYIDGEGCVYIRSGKDWALRLDKNGVRVCGFPPTLDVRRTDPDTLSVLSPVDEPDADPVEHFEEELLSQLAGGLRAGEFTADHHHEREKRLEPAEPESDGGIKKTVERLSRLREAIEVATATGLANSDLCRQLGYEPDPDPKPIIGGDVTQGMCPGMRPTTAKMREVVKPTKVAAKEEAAKDIPEAEEKPRDEGQLGPYLAAVVPLVKPAMQPPVAGLRKPAVLDHGDLAGVQPLQVAAADSAASETQSGMTAQETSNAGSVAATEGLRVGNQRPPRKNIAGEEKASQVQAEKPQIEEREQIPASARYVEIGGFADHDIAAIAMRQLARMGYPVAKSDVRKSDRTVRHVMAGPFNDRSLLASALRTLRTNGYTGAFPR